MRGRPMSPLYSSMRKTFPHLKQCQEFRQTSWRRGSSVRFHRLAQYSQNSPVPAKAIPYPKEDQKLLPPRLYRNAMNSISRPTAERVSAHPVLRGIGGDAFAASNVTLVVVVEAVPTPNAAPPRPNATPVPVLELWEIEVPCWNATLRRCTESELHAGQQYLIEEEGGGVLIVWCPSAEGCDSRVSARWGLRSGRQRPSFRNAKEHHRGWRRSLARRYASFRARPSPIPMDR